MRLRILIIGGLIVCLSGTAGAQTLYNAPSRQSESSAPAPLNLRNLLRRNQPQVPTAIPYAIPKADTQMAQREAALAQWSAQRDAQAYLDQQKANAYMAALSESPSPAAFGTMSQQPGQTTGADGPAQPHVPMIYRKKDDPGIAKPRPLFNSVR